MQEYKKFTGFSPKTIQFFKELKKNNNRDWFQAHKDEYCEYVKKPAQAFVHAIAPKLMSLRSYIHVDEKRSLYRIYRDIRYSKDKTPYKIWQSFIFWEGSFPRTENSSFYLSLSPDGLSIGAGVYCTPKSVLEAFRKEIAGDGAKKFAKMVSQIEGQGIEILGKEYKRYPRGFTEDDANAEFLLFKKLYVMEREPISDIIFSEDLVDYVFKKYKCIEPLHAWLVDLSKKASL